MKYCVVVGSTCITGLAAVSTALEYSGSHGLWAQALNSVVKRGEVDIYDDFVLLPRARTRSQTRAQNQAQNQGQAVQEGNQNLGVQNGGVQVAGHGNQARGRGHGRGRGRNQAAVQDGGRGRGRGRERGRGRGRGINADDVSNLPIETARNRYLLRTAIADNNLNNNPEGPAEGDRFQWHGPHIAGLVAGGITSGHMGQRGFAESSTETRRGRGHIASYYGQPGENTRRRQYEANPPDQTSGVHAWSSQAVGTGAKVPKDQQEAVTFVQATGNHRVESIVTSPRGGRATFRTKVGTKLTELVVPENQSVRNMRITTQDAAPVPQNFIYHAVGIQGGGEARVIAQQRPRMQAPPVPAFQQPPPPPPPLHQLPQAPGTPSF